MNDVFYKNMVVNKLKQRTGKIDVLQGKRGK